MIAVFLEKQLPIKAHKVVLLKQEHKANFSWCAFSAQTC